MTAIVLHSAGEVDGPRARRQLAESRGVLAEVGIGLPDSDDSAEWSKAARQLLRGTGGDRVSGLLARAREGGLATVVLSTDDLVDRLPDETTLKHLRRWARHHDATVSFVVTVEDQIAALNSRYCRAVLQLDWAGSFAEYVDDASHLGQVDYASRLDVLLDGPLDTVVVSRQAAGDNPVAALLSALALPDDQVRGVALAPLGGPVPSPGPLLVAAVRLLNKRMRRLSLFSRYPRPTLLTSVDTLVDRAGAGNWDSAPFWGWSQERSGAAVERFARGNAELARRVWGATWREPTAGGAANEADLAAADPALLVDLLDTVDSLVHDLRRGSGTDEPTASAS